LPEYERFTLEYALHGRMLGLEFRKRILDVFRSIADRDVWQQVEVERDAGELIQMVHSLRADNFLCRCYNTHWNQG
jgi:hypothetical protein